MIAAALALYAAQDDEGAPGIGSNPEADGEIPDMAAMVSTLVSALRAHTTSRIKRKGMAVIVMLLIGSRRGFTFSGWSRDKAKAS
jgi:hypothetical protein